MVDAVLMLSGNVGALTEKVGRQEAGFEKLSRQYHQLRQDIIKLDAKVESARRDLGAEVSELRAEFVKFQSLLYARFAELLSRLDAIVVRLDEVESTIDLHAKELRAATIELLSQFNAILTATQDSARNQITLRELTERIERLERRLGM